MFSGSVMLQDLLMIGIGKMLFHLTSVVSELKVISVEQDGRNIVRQIMHGSLKIHKSKILNESSREDLGINISK
jgi:hypothetical protein